MKWSMGGGYVEQLRRLPAQKQFNETYLTSLFTGDLRTNLCKYTIIPPTHNAHHHY